MDNVCRLDTLFDNAADAEACEEKIAYYFGEDMAGVRDLTQLMMRTSNWRERYEEVAQKGERGFYQVVPEDFFLEDPENRENIVSRTRENVLPYIDRDGMRNMHKYTVVFWLEGNDPDCTNELMNGHIGMNFQIKGEAEDYMDEIITGTDPTEEPTEAA